LNEYVQIKKSHAFLIADAPLFIKNSNNEFVLYKSENIKLDHQLYDDKHLPALFIHHKDKTRTVAEIQKALNIALYDQIRAKGLNRVKKILNEVVQEALMNPTEGGLDHLPETIELLFDAYSKESQTLKLLADMSDRRAAIAEHSINVMIFAMNLSIFTGFPADDAKLLSLSALLHDIGKLQLPENISVAAHRLSNDEFDSNKKHTVIGYDLLKNSPALGQRVAVGALEHHERLDGSGYPMGIKNVSLDGQMIGIINSFEHLSYREKSYRKVKKPFDAMSVIRNEVMEEGKFCKGLFAELCKSLG